MIRRKGNYPVSVRDKMRGGNGQVTVETFWKPQEEMKAKTRLLAKLSLEPGSSIGFHEHAGEEEVYIITRGKGRLTENGASYTVVPGDSILTGNGAGHAIESIGTEPLEIIAVIVQY